MRHVSVAELTTRVVNAGQTSDNEKLLAVVASNPIFNSINSDLRSITMQR